MGKVPPRQVSAFAQVKSDPVIDQLCLSHQDKILKAILLNSVHLMVLLLCRTSLFLVGKWKRAVTNEQTGH